MPPPYPDALSVTRRGREPFWRVQHQGSLSSQRDFATVTEDSLYSLRIVRGEASCARLHQPLSHHGDRQLDPIEPFVDLRDRRIFHLDLLDACEPVSGKEESDHPRNSRQEREVDADCCEVITHMIAGDESDENTEKCFDENPCDS